MHTQPVALHKPGETENSSANLPLRSRYARFGDFQLDTAREELTLDGARVKLQGKVYQILQVLLDQPGDIVTREQVRKRLWPEDLHVNFDANVNTTINKLRQALCDVRGMPTYIETIPRRGYSFIAPVEFSDTPFAGKLASPAQGDPVPAASTPAAPSLADSVRHPRVRVLFLVLTGLLLGSSLMLFWYARAGRTRNTSHPPQTPASVVAPPSTGAPFSPATNL